MKKCKEIMTKDLIYCLPSNMVSEAAELMRKECIGSVLVIESEKSKKLVGIVTDRDLALKVIADGLDAKSTQVEVVMTHKVITRHSNNALQKVLDSMSKHQLRRIPIVDKDNKILGIIAQADVATRVDRPKKTAAMMKEVSQADRK
jgi:CBS domain-containing protein